MNVIIANEAKALLSQLDIDVIKSVDGVHTADEIVEMFKNFFYARMILDITAIKDYDNITNIQKISIGLDADKIILLLLIMKHQVLVVTYQKLFQWEYIILQLL